jgi:NADPH:quinone reductase-like Zn-dependent oxidoreductase
MVPENHSCSDAIGMSLSAKSQPLAAMSMILPSVKLYRAKVMSSADVVAIASLVDVTCVIRPVAWGVNRPGAFAEYLSIPVTNVWPRSPHSPRYHLCFDPLGNAVHSPWRSSPGEDVLITGAGPIGIMAVAVAKHAGARYVVISDVNPYRLELARKMAQP